MIIKAIIDEDFSNYKKPSMFIGFPSCTFKCEKECGKRVCQNGVLATSPDIDVNTEYIIERYLRNNITSAIVFGGLEPFDSWEDIISLISKLRNDYHCSDTVVIYTGYKEDEIKDYLKAIKEYKNIVVKFGRFVPDEEKHFDEVLGIWLASKNQYAKEVGGI